MTAKRKSSKKRTRKADDDESEKFIGKETGTDKERRVILHLTPNEISEYRFNSDTKDDHPGYFKILEEFSLGYPSQTNIACWWCCHRFQTRPVGIPMKFDGKSFKALGCFCSFNCAYAYCLSSKSFHKQIGDLLFMYKTLYSGNQGELRPAPDRIVLKMFGGELTIEEFREASSKDILYSVIQYPMMPWGMYCDEILYNSRNFARHGLKKPLEIKKAKKVTSSGNDSSLELNTSQAGPSGIREDKGKKPAVRTTIDQLISFV